MLSLNSGDQETRRPGSLLHCYSSSAVCHSQNFLILILPKTPGMWTGTFTAHLEWVRGAQDLGVYQRRTRTWSSSGRKGETDSTTGLSLNQPVLVGCPKAISWGGNGNIHQIVANLVVLRTLSVLLIHLICFNPVCSALL